MLKILQKYKNNTQVNLLNFWNQGLFWPFLQLLLLKLRKDGHTCWSTVHANILNGERRSKKMLSIRKIYFNFPWVLTKKYNWFVMQKLLIFQLCTFRKKTSWSFWLHVFVIVVNINLPKGTTIHAGIFFCLFSLVLNYCEGVDMLREAGIDMNYDEDLRYVKG